MSFSMMLAAPSKPATAQAYSASLTPVAGLIQYKAKGSADWVNIFGRQLVRAGDGIRTGDNGFAKLSVVTGITVEIYPTTEIELVNLSIANSGGKTYIVSQSVGHLFTDVNQRLSSNDRIQVVIPNASIKVTGTQFWTTVSPRLNGAVLSQQNEVTVDTGDGKSFTVTPEKFLYAAFNLPQPIPTNCTTTLLSTATTSTFILVPLTGFPDREGALRSFLKDFLRSNVNDLSRAYLRQVLGLLPVNLDDLSPTRNTQELDDLIKAIDNADISKIDLLKLLSSYQQFWRGTYQDNLKAPLAPSTCGNGRQDDNETPLNCPADFSSLLACGNGYCETDRLDIKESLLNCPADCDPARSLARSCAALNIGAIPPTGGGGGGGGGSGTPNPSL